MNQQWFRVNPLLIWTIQSGLAHLGGRDLGPPAPLGRQAHLADFWMPQRGLFAVGRAYVDPLHVGGHPTGDRHGKVLHARAHEAATPELRATRSTLNSSERRADQLAEVGGDKESLTGLGEIR